MKRISRKKCTAIGMICGLVVGSAATGVLASSYVQALLNQDINISLNGVVQEFRDETTGEVQFPLTYKDRTYLPLRNVATLSGLSVDYDANTNTAILKTSDYVQNNIPSEENMVGGNGVYTNSKGEVIKFLNYDWRSLSDTNITSEDIADELKAAIKPNSQHGHYHITFDYTGLQDEYREAVFELSIASYMSDSDYVIDSYKISDDKKSLISLKRGPEYNLSLINATYDLTQYINDTVDFHDSLTGVYEKDDEKIIIIKNKDRNSIVYINSDSMSDCYYLFEVDLNSIMEYSYPLKVYFEKNDVSQVKRVYQLPNYANYFTGLVEYKDGRVEWLSCRFSGVTEDNKPNLELGVKEEHKKVQELTAKEVEHYSEKISEAR